MIEDIFELDMATESSRKLAKEMCFLMRELREKSINPETGKPYSIRKLCEKRDLDFSVMSRAENPKETSIPSISYFIDWAELLGVDIGDIYKQAKKRIKWLSPLERISQITLPKNSPEKMSIDGYLCPSMSTFKNKKARSY